MTTTFQPPSIDLSFPSEFGFEKVAREAVAAFARRFGFEHERIDDLKTALGEACINAIEHGNRRSPGMRVNVHCACDGSRLVVEIYDQGVARFEGFGTPVPIEQKLEGQAPARGMGLLIITQLVDESGFSDGPNGGNRFWFAIHRQALDQA